MSETNLFFSVIYEHNYSKPFMTQVLTKDCFWYTNDLVLDTSLNKFIDFLLHNKVISLQNYQDIFIYFC